MLRRFAWLKIRDQRAFVLLTSVLFFVYFANGLWSPLLSVYVQSLGAETAQIGLVVATFQITNLLSQYSWGRLSDRLGRRKPLLLLGTLGLALAYIGVANATSYVWLFAARGLEGVALSAYSTGSLALIGDLLEDQSSRGPLMGVYRTFGSLAFAIASISGGVLADRFGLYVPFVVAAFGYVLACVLGIQIREVQLVPAQRSVVITAAPVASHSQLLASNDARRALWSFLLLLFAWMFATSAVGALWPVYMSNVGYSATWIGGFWALAALGEVPCMILSGHLADRWGRKRILLTGMVCMSAVYFAYTMSTMIAWLLIVQLLRSFAYASFEAPALLYATELGLRRQRGRLVGLYYSAGSLGSILGAILGGIVAQGIGLPLMFRSIVVCMLATALVMSKVMPRLHTGSDATAELAPTQQHG